MLTTGGTRRSALRCRNFAVGAAMLGPAVLAAGCTTTGGTPVAASTSTGPGSDRPTSTGPAPSTGATSSGTTAGATTAAGFTSGVPSTLPAPVAGGGSGLLWTQRANKPLDQAEPVGDAVAVYVLDGSALSIEVVAAATGRIRWRQPAATGLAAAGVEIEPTVVDGRIVYLRPVGGSMTSTAVVVADAVTGRDVAVSSTSYRVDSRPAACGHQVCFSAYSGSDRLALTMDPVSGRITFAGAATGGRIIGPAGLQSRQSPTAPEQLRRTVAGRTVWQTPLATVFGAGYSTNGGWEFHALPSRDLLIGEVGTFDPDDLRPSEIKLGTTREMVGIELSDGARRWLQTGRCRVPVRSFGGGRLGRRPGRRTVPLGRGEHCGADRRQVRAQDRNAEHRGVRPGHG